ncbi:response regulator receiver [Desulfurispirillum indicum S5]|uniref:Response regulator receiver n=1 Tax=Desulfurispirillum indicum (strain ATCC BAA-1389 / DSM 22839 / S5) TaxID=653733 RepID=E6W7A8_DESIS|nr:response regulator receiver [Desulfurispirillum indicum S5]
MEVEEILKNKSVLIVEDEPLTRQMLARILSFRVGEVIVAANGKEGLELFHSRNPDIILSDLEMPVMNGADMIRAIRQVSPDKPIVVITAFDDDEHLACEADCVLVKPIFKKELLGVLAAVAQKL